MERMKINDPEWYEQANCATVEPEMMFPTSGAGFKLARKVCAECVVVDDCLASAINEEDIDNGFRGGLSARARRELFNRLENGNGVEVAKED